MKGMRAKLFEVFIFAGWGWFWLIALTGTAIERLTRSHIPAGFWLIFQAIFGVITLFGFIIAFVYIPLWIMGYVVLIYLVSAISGAMYVAK